VRASDADTTLILMSDHGFAAIRSEVYLNRWLADEGFLRLTNGAKNLEGVGTDTAAFALDPSRLYLNVRGKYPRGGVEPGAEYEHLRDALAERLLGMRFEGESVVRAVLRKEEVYHGPWLERAPDLVLLAHHGFDLKGALGKPGVFGRSHLTGGHTQDDAFLYTQAGIPVPERPHISDLAGLILAEFERAA
jgi:predicted AlkP superfamily phosphohydrolase/phosphomutase